MAGNKYEKDQFNRPEGPVVDPGDPNEIPLTWSRLGVEMERGTLEKRLEGKTHLERRAEIAEIAKSARDS